MKKLFLILAVLFSATVFLSAADDFIIIRMVRHGQPGVGGTLFTPEMKSSWIRLGLTPLGIRQAQITGEFLKKEPASLPSRISYRFWGFRPLAMTISQPQLRQISAAWSLVTIPPVP